MDFQNLYDKALIDHSTTSQDDFQVDGLAEWMV
jgi:hypothetical protein